MNSIDEAISVVRGTNWGLRNRAEVYLAAHASLETLQPLATDSDWKIRLSAVRAIAQFPGPSAAAHGLLRRCLSNETDDWVTRNLQWGLTNHSERGG